METSDKLPRVSILFAGRRRSAWYQLLEGKLILHSSFGRADASLSRYGMAARSSLARALLRSVVAKHETTNSASEMQHQQRALPVNGENRTRTAKTQVGNC